MHVYPFNNISAPIMQIVSLHNRSITWTWIYVKIESERKGEEEKEERMYNGETLMIPENGISENAWPMIMRQQLYTKTETAKTDYYWKYIRYLAYLFVMKFFVNIIIFSCIREFDKLIKKKMPLLKIGIYKNCLLLRNVNIRSEGRILRNRFTFTCT